MGKPYTAQDWELPVANEEKKSSNSPPTEKFSKSFQEYLNTRLTLEDLMKAETPPKDARRSIAKTKRWTPSYSHI